MASIIKECTIASDPDEVWAAVRDWGALHERLAPGFVTATEVDGGDRVVTFFNGAVARERIVTVDDTRRRLVWSIVEGRYDHHNGAAQVFGSGEREARLVWTADLLPDEHAAATEQMMERGIEAIAAALSGAASVGS